MGLVSYLSVFTWPSGATAVYSDSIVSGALQAAALAVPSCVYRLQIYRAVKVHQR